MLRAKLGPLRDVEPADQRLAVGGRECVEDLLGGLGVDEDVELRGRRRVARILERTAHDDQAAEELRQLRVAPDRERDVGERPGGYEHDLDGPAARLFDEQVRREARRRGRSRLRERGVAEALRAMARGGHQRDHERPEASRRDLDIACVHDQVALQ